MATGIEIASLVLGAFPVAVKSVAALIQGMELLDDFRNFRRPLRNYSRRLNVEAIHYQQNLQHLLLCSKIATRGLHLSELLDDPRHEAWRSQENDVLLRRYLGFSFDVYMESMRALASNLEEFRRKLFISSPASDAKDLWQEMPFLVRKYREARIVVSKNSIDATMKGIEKTNLDLRALTKENEYINNTYYPDNTYSLETYLETKRIYHEELYGVLADWDYWECLCRHRNVACLRIEPVQTATLCADNTDDNSCHDHRMLVARLDADTMYKSGSEIKVNAGKELVVHPVEVFNLEASLLCKRQDGPLLTYLCRDIFDPREQKVSTKIGYLQSQKLRKVRHTFCDTPSERQIQVVYLSSLLQKRSSTGYGQGLLRVDRLFLASSLAAGIVQVGETAWMKGLWSSNEVFLLLEDEAKVRKLSLNGIYPYFCWSLAVFEKHLEERYQIPEAAQSFVRSKVVYALGMTLVELCLGKTLADLKEQVDDTSSDFGTKMRTATRLINDVELEEGAGYRQVVDKCLYSRFDVGTFGMDDVRFQQALTRDVVKPLRGMLDIFNGIN